MNQSIVSPFDPPAPKGNRQRWSSLYGSASALAITQASIIHNRFTLVITEDTASALKTQTEIKFFAGSKFEVLQLPDWETLPYDSFSPHQDIISERISTLATLPSIKSAILVVSASTLIQRLAPVSFIAGNHFSIATNQNLSQEQLRKQLDNAGYRRVDTVFDHGEYAIRGSIIDMFPTGIHHPLRIDWFDDEIDTIRTFDTETQITINKIDKINLMQAREFPVNDKAINEFQNRWHQEFSGNYKKVPLYQDVSQGIIPPGIEYYLPLFFDDTSTLLDYLPKDALIIAQGNIEDSIEQFWNDLQDRYENYHANIERPILKPKYLYLRSGEIFQSLKQFDGVVIENYRSQGHVNFDCLAPPKLNVDHRLSDPYQRLIGYLKDKDYRVLICAESMGRREILLESLSKLNIRPQIHETWYGFLESDAKLGITVSDLEQGMELPAAKIAIVTEDPIIRGLGSTTKTEKTSTDY